MKRWKTVVLVIIVALGLSGVGVSRYLVPYQLEDEIKAAKAQGVATSFAELVRPVPRDQDAGPDYDGVNGNFSRFDEALGHYTPQTLTTTTGPSRIDMKRLLAELRKATDLRAAVHAAAAKSGCSFPTDTDNRTFVPFTHLAEMHDAARFLRIDALTQMWDGRPVEAAKTLGLGVNVAKHAYNQPTMFGALRGFLIDAEIDDGFKLLLLKHGENAEVDRVIRDSLRDDLARCDIAHALAASVAEDCWIIRSGTWYSRVPPILKGVYSKTQAATAIHWNTKLIVASRLPSDRKREAIQRVIHQAQVASQHNPVVRAGVERLPLILQEIDRLDGQTARRRTIYAAACVLEYRARKGVYPAKLADAVQPVPTDPFSGAPLSYKRTAKGFELVFAEAARRAGTKTHARMLFAYPAPGIR